MHFTAPLSAQPIALGSRIFMEFPYPVARSGFPGGDTPFAIRFSSKLTDPLPFLPDFSQDGVNVRPLLLLSPG